MCRLPPRPTRLCFRRSRKSGAPRGRGLRLEIGETAAAQALLGSVFVVIVESDHEELEKARDEGFTVIRGDGTDESALREAGIEEAKTVVATTADDDFNLLVCQLARTKFRIGHVLARVNDPQNMSAFQSLDVTAIDAPLSTAYAIDNEIGDGHDIQQTEVTSESLAGKTIREVNAEIPQGCIVAEVGQGADAHVPEADDRIELGEQITFLGDADAVADAVRRFHPHA